MPNHVTHRLVILGPAAAIAAFREACILPNEDGELSLDFNALIPMPDVVKATESSSAVSDGLIALGQWDFTPPPAIFGFREPSVRERAEAMLRLGWVEEAGVTTIEELQTFLKKRSPTCEAVAQRSLDCFHETGHMDWYGWSTANWGTKWNCYSFVEVSDQPERYEITFDTAWSPPYPIFQAIAERFPELTIDITAFDEGWNFAFTGAILNGRYNGADTEATSELYEVVYGQPPELDDEEEEPAVDATTMHEAASGP